MKLESCFFVALAVSFSLFAEELKISADSIKASRETGEVRAEGNVKASLPPVIMRSNLVAKSPDGVYDFDESTEVTTCTNAVGHRHWFARGHVEYKEGEYVWMSNGWLGALEWPLIWLPCWYYPIDTDYGWRVMTGYSDRHGTMLFTRYLYHLAGTGRTGYGLWGSSGVDLRYENGVAINQGIGWSLGDYGTGRFRVYYAWDEDCDRYGRYWYDPRHYNYRNWGSKVDRERWALQFEHQGDLTERDHFRVEVASFSDSYFQSDFLRNQGLYGGGRNVSMYARNEAVLEHIENSFGLGLSVSGPIDEFQSGVGRLPEFYFDIVPQSLFGLPINYESQTRVGYYCREAAEYGDRRTSEAYRYSPGIWANYNTFRLDTYHRLTAPFKVDDALSVVPRVGYHGTFWGDSGYTSVNGRDRAGETGDSVFRSIVEGGVTFAGRGSADFDNGWRHITEPYLDVLAQDASYSGLSSGARPYVFDSIDASGDFLDQFAGRSRNLPYTYYGVTPGWRNVWRQADDGYSFLQKLELDVYVAVQLNSTDWTEGNKYHRLAENPKKPNYGEHEGTVVPGMRFKWNAGKDTAFYGRAEWDGENDCLAYGELDFEQRLSDEFSWFLRYIGRDHRVWDYSSAYYNPAQMSRESFNYAYQKLGEIGFVHDVCDAIAWGPYLQWDFEESELSELGGWIDYRLDCLGFRLLFNYESEYERIDGSRTEDGFSVGFYVYLRALGPNLANPFAY